MGDLTSYVEASKDDGEVLEDEKVEEDKSDEGLVFPRRRMSWWEIRLIGPGYFTSYGHYIVIDSYRDGKFLINDPYYYSSNTLEAQPFWRLKQEATIGWVIKK